ncbi:MAG TPA: translocation/assembly module TamB domain-containing protein [Myxococcota bacterium]
MPRKRLIALAALCALALGALFAVRSESVLRALAARVPALTRGRVAIEGASGSLLGPLRAARVSVRTGETRSVAERVEIAPRWRALASGALAFEAVTIGALRIEPGPASAEPPQQPHTLALPFTLEIARLEIAELTLAPSLELRQIRGSLRLGRDAHEAELARLVSPWGELAGRARVEAQPPFALAGELEVARDEPPRTRARVVASGSLVAAALRLTGTLDEAPLDGEASVAAFARPWLGALGLRGEHVDVASFVRSENAPHSDLTVRIEANGAADALLAGSLRAENAKPGPLSQHALPVRALDAGLRVGGGVLDFSGLDADLGAAGSARGDARVEHGALQLALDVQRLDAHAVHESLRATQLAGELRAQLSAARIEGTLALRERGRELRGRVVREGEAVRAEDVRIAIGRGEISGHGAWDGASAFELEARFAAFDPSALGDFPSASLSGDVTAAGELGDAWNARVRYALNGSRYRGRALEGRGELTLGPARVSHADAQLRLGANTLRARGAFGAPGDALELALSAPDVGALGGEFGGELALDARLLGTLAHPGGELTASAHELSLPGGLGLAGLDARAAIGASGARALSASLHLAELTLGGVRIDSTNLSADGTLAAHAIALDGEAQGLALRAQLSGGWTGAWSGRIDALETSGRFVAKLLEPAPLEYAPPARATLGPTRLQALGGELAIGSLALAERRIESAGVANDIALGELLALLGRDPSAAGDLRVRGVWVVPADPAQLGQVRLELASGDAQIGGAALGIRALSIDAALGASVAHVDASLAGERLGHARLRADLRAASGRALLARSSELSASLAGEVSSIRALGGLLGISARVEGSGAFDLEASGSLGAPRFAGAVQADALRFDWPAAAISLRDGKLRARLEPGVVHVDALSFAAAKGELRASGEVPLDGRPAELAWEADHLRVLDRPDRNLEVTGKGSASVDARGLALRGKLRANRGYLEVPQIRQSRLGDDVIVLGRERSAQRASGSARLELDLELDAGKKLRVVGSGLDTYLRGKLRVKTLPDGALVAFGEIDASRGSYRAFGQKLEIERGALIFNGAIDDPALDVLALRKNLEVEAGVELTGTLKAPLARLTSSPPVPDSEKLSWIMLGHGASDASAADTALLQAATATLFSGGDAVPLEQRVARIVGLDEISLRSTGESASAEASDRAVALGKRLSDKFYVEYEYGLEAASHLVRLHYTLTRALSVRAETSGDAANLGVNFRKSWD